MNDNDIHNKDAEERLLSVAEFCRLADIFRTALYYHIHKGRIRVVLSKRKEGSTSPIEDIIMIPASELMPFLENKATWMRKKRRW